MAESDHAKRYREAGEMLLEQLDWCVEYLNRIRKYDIAKSVARNRDEIRRRLRDA